MSLRQSYNLEGGSGIDISAYSLPVQLFLYMFFPLFTPPFTALSFVASIENTIFLLVSIYLLFLLLTRKRATSLTLFLSSYSVVSLICLAVTTSNTGIALRQKWMFLPALLVLTLIMASKPFSRPLQSDHLLIEHPNTR